MSMCGRVYKNCTEHDVTVGLTGVMLPSGFTNRKSQPKDSD